MEDAGAFKELLFGAGSRMETQILQINLMLSVINEKSDSRNIVG